MSTIKWTVDPAHSQIRFIARHMVVSRVSGSFDKFHAVVETEGEDIESAKISFTADTNSVNTGVKQRDDHLRSDDFFNAEKFPQISFKSSSIEKIDEEEYKLHGDLTIRDVTRPITLEVAYGGKIKDPYGNQRMGFEVTGKLSRKEYGLKYNALLESGGAVVGDKITLDIPIEFYHS